MTNDKQRERLVELFAQLEDPSSTCPRFGTNKVCEGCKYLKGDECDLTGRFADYLLANGVIVPPCKVGDVVYRLDGFVWKYECGECEYFDEGWYDCPNMCEKTGSSKKPTECIEIKEEKITFEDILRYLYWNDFGKTVFLTKEEAEAKLKEGV